MSRATRTPGPTPSDHDALGNLEWVDSGHIGDTWTLAAFDGSGDAIYFDLDDFQPADDDLDALAAITGTGLVVRTDDTPETYATRTLAIGAGSTGFTGADLDGVAGPPTFTLAPHVLLALYVDPRFGDGSDGVVTLTADTRLLADMNATDLHLAGFKLFNNGFRIFVRNTLYMEGGQIVGWTGAGTPLGIAVHGGANFAGNGAGVGGPLGPGGNGGIGGSAGSNGTTAAAVTSSWSQHRALGDGTTGAGGAGGGGGVGRGAGGTVAQPAASLGWTTSSLHLGVIFGTALSRLFGGSGGGGGKSSTGFAGGGAAGGGIVVVCARYVDGTGGAGVIHADGGVGGTATGANSDGGGGGGGGHVHFVYARLVAGSLPTLRAAGGLGGGALGTGIAGIAGNAGTTETVCVLT